MRYDIAQRTKALHEHVRNRLGRTITFNRFKNEVYDAEEGTTYVYWEQPSFKCSSIYEASTKNIADHEGVVRQGDLMFVFAASDLSQQTGTDAAGRSDIGKPKPGDTITYDVGEYDIDLGDGERSMLAWLDPSEVIWHCVARRRD